MCKMAGALWGLAAKIRKEFGLSEDVNTDNQAFRLVSKISVGFCIAGQVTKLSHSHFPQIFSNKDHCKDKKESTILANKGVIDLPIWQINDYIYQRQPQ